MSNRLLIYIIIGLVAGALFGGQFPSEAGYVAFLGTLFMNALKMIVVPLVVASLIVGVANLGDLTKLGGIGKRTIIYYMATTGLSVIVGLALVNIIQPGVGLTRGGETHLQAQYQVDNLRVTLLNTQLGTTTYDDRYQIILKDQELSGVIDPSKPHDNTQMSVKRWEDPRTGATVTPQSNGAGIAIDLAVADVVRGKDRSIFDVLVDVIVGMIPTNIFSSMVNTEILPLIVFSLLFGGVLITLGDVGKPVLTLINGINEAIMKIVHIVVAFTPIGVFGLVAGRMSIVGGWEGFLPELIKLGWYASTVILGLLLHGFITLPLILMFFAKKNVLTYASNMLTALSTAFSTSSSSATLPVTLEGVEKNGVSERTGSFVLPLGATINMDGTALYEAIAAVFIAQVYGIVLGPVEQVVIFLTATLAAIGAAGIPQAGLVTMVIVLKAVGLPIEGITLILVIDWFLDRCRTTINVWGDAVGAAVVERYEQQA
ncbi:MAG: dicarboxylate/amino acid:cation symporter [Candidatus Latescibacterota bacterium]